VKYKQKSPENPHTLYKMLEMFVRLFLIYILYINTRVALLQLQQYYRNICFEGNWQRGLHHKFHKLSFGNINGYKETKKSLFQMKKSDLRQFRKNRQS